MINEGETVSFQCLTDAPRTANVVWSRVGTLTFPNGIFQRGEYLVMTWASGIHEGIYSCSVSNESRAVNRTLNIGKSSYLYEFGNGS